MANDNTKLQYIVELLTQGDTKKATDELNKLNKAGKDAATGIGGLQTGFAKLFAFIGGAQFIKQSIDAFVEQEKAVAKLNAALKVSGQYTPELSEEMQKLSEAMASTSLYADEAILNVIAKLTAAGAKSKDIERLTRAVLDLSTLMDRDLNRATLAFAQALNGETGALKQAGIQIDETANATDRLNESLEQIEKRAGGQSQESVKGLAGEFKLLKDDIDGAMESSGKFFLSIYSGLRAMAKEAGGGFVDLRRYLGAGAGPVDTSPPAPTSLLTPASWAALKGSSGGASRVETAGASLQDQLADLEEIARLDDEIVKLTNEQAEARHLIALAVEDEMEDTFQRFENGERIKQDLVDQTVLVMLDGEARIRAEMEINHDNRVRMINDEKFESQDQYDAAMRAEALLFAEEKRRHHEAQTFSGRMKVDIEQLGEQGMRSFSSGLAGAMVDAFSEGEKAFQKFAANFMKQIAEMILQMIIFNALKSATKSFFSGGGQATAMAAGGMIYAAGGISGVSEVTRATHFPNFNVVAGEAGREVMTVLARPSFERINGVPAQIGYAGGNRLAITSADALASAGGGAGGNITIEVRVSQGSEARIIENSVKQARVAVVQDMSNDSQLSRVTRQKMA